MNTLTVYEKYSRHWPAIAVVSAVLAIVCWGAYMYATDVLIEGYLRFAAFCFFALSLLSFFKVKDGRIQINFTYTNDGGLKLDYLIRNQAVARDAFDLDQFEAVEVNQMPNRSLYNDFATGDRTVRFKNKNSDDWLYLAELHGRVIPFENKNAEKVQKFVTDKIGRGN